jgi:aminoglycoside 3-N-acetyltransferase I
MNEAFQIKRLRQEDVQIFYKLIGLFQEIFETGKQLKAEESYLTRLLENPGFIVYVAALENEIVGGLTAYELPMYNSMDSELFIYDIAIKPGFQRKGLGKQLLSSLKKHCEQNNIRLMFVEAHEEDEHAVAFYHSAGGHAEKVIQFNYLLAP